MALAGEKVVYSGETVTIPLPGGEGRPMRLSGTPCPDVPIYLATLSPRMLRLTGEIADGWLGTSFVPEAAAAYLTHLDAGLASAGRTPRRPRRLPGRRGGVRGRRGRARAAWSTTGGRASRSASAAWARRRTNFYNAAYSRQGWAEVAAQRAGTLASRRPGRRGRARHRRDGARHHADRHRADGARSPRRVAGTPGVDTVRLYPAGETLDDQVATLGRAIELVREISTPEPARSAPPAGTPGAGGSGPPAP